jgi:hypothetical protein
VVEDGADDSSSEALTATVFDGDDTSNTPGAASLARPGWCFGSRGGNGEDLAVATERGVVAGRRELAVGLGQVIQGAVLSE